MVRLSHRNVHIQSPEANGNAQDNVGMPVRRQTIPETLGRYAGSLRPPPDADNRSYPYILYVVVTCVKWIPPKTYYLSLMISMILPGI